MPHTAVPALVGLEVNATCLRAVAGAAGCSQVLPLDGARAELPLALSLEGRAPAVGRAGVGLCRQSPHLACTNFLPLLGQAKTWAAGRHRLDAAQALAHVLGHLRDRCDGTHGLALTLPVYLTRAQVGLLVPLAEKARLSVLGSVPAPLAAAMAAYAELPWAGTAVVIDVDEHALTCTAVSVEGDGGQVRALGSQVLTQVCQRIWKERLLNRIADRCVRQTRRDPRDSAAAEQLLYDQFDTVLALAGQGQTADVAVQGTNWCQNVLLRPDEVTACCAPLVRHALDSLAHLAKAHGEPSAVVLTAAAAALPGLVPALEHGSGPPVAIPEDEPTNDFGESLLPDAAGTSAVSVLEADALARAAHRLAARFFQHELPRGHLEAVPLPPPEPLDAGPARLVFHNQEYPLRGACFTLGRHSSCDLVFDTAHYPTVSARHCEIVYERRTYVLRDRSRNGTLVNDRPVIQQMALHPGDWIRLGPGGPLLRFLGQSVISGQWSVVSG